MSFLKNYSKIKLSIHWFFYILFFTAFLTSLFQQNWLNLFLSLLTIIILALSKYFSRNLTLEFPGEIEVAILFLIYASIFLGEMSSFYLKFWWWDIFLHAFSGILIATIAFFLVYVLNKKSTLRMSPLFVTLFTFSFAIALGTIWEIFEFSIDLFLSTNMQKSGLVDTMGDLILDTAGATIVSLAAYFYLRCGQKNLISRLVNKFLKNNKEYFK